MMKAKKFSRRDFLKAASLWTTIVSNTIFFPLVMVGPYRIMSCGDSFVGFYIDPFRQLLTQNGQLFQTVGSVGGVHEGHIGYRSDQIAANVTNWLGAYPPKVFQLYVGANDILQNISGLETGFHIPQIIQKVREFDPSIRIMIAKIAEIEGYRDQVLTLNSFIQTLDVDGIVDMFIALPFNSQNVLQDGIHPTPGGSFKMALAWLSGLNTLNL